MNILKSDQNAAHSKKSTVSSGKSSVSALALCFAQIAFACQEADMLRKQVEQEAEMLKKKSSIRSRFAYPQNRDGRCSSTGRSQILGGSHHKGGREGGSCRWSGVWIPLIDKAQRTCEYVQQYTWNPEEHSPNTPIQAVSHDEPSVSHHRINNNSIKSEISEHNFSHFSSLATISGKHTDGTIWNTQGARALLYSQPPQVHSHPTSMPIHYPPNKSATARYLLRRKMVSSSSSTTSQRTTGPGRRTTGPGTSSARHGASTMAPCLALLVSLEAKRGLVWSILGWGTSWCW